MFDPKPVAQCANHRFELISRERAETADQPDGGHGYDSLRIESADPKKACRHDRFEARASWACRMRYEGHKRPLVTFGPAADDQAGSHFCCQSEINQPDFSPLVGGHQPVISRWSYSRKTCSAAWFKSSSVRVGYWTSTSRFSNWASTAFCSRSGSASNVAMSCRAAFVIIELYRSQTGSTLSIRCRGEKCKAYAIG